ncbi:MAG: hypothetical protein NHG13_00965 [Candidatus Shikimatogenerans bostrichidophilus]|nr:MAG: hypothetical protein NHG13_00965 [Candidatus Shikimatogenerans bostrichidophilus]
MIKKKKKKKKKFLNIFNKKKKIIYISAKKKKGIKKILNLIKKKIPNINNYFINNIRHYNELKGCLKYIKKIKKNYKKKIPLELISIDLRKAISYLYNLNGKTFDNNEILNNIFSKFCIGK